MVFPLTRHNFPVSACYQDVSIQARLVVSVHHRTAITYVSTNRTVVRSLRGGVAILGPTQGLDTEGRLTFNHLILLFDTEPWLFAFCLVQNLLREVSEVSVRRLQLLVALLSKHVRLTHHYDIVALSERVWVESDGSQQDLGIECKCLVA